MTTPNGAIVFNASTGGSDTAASGLGPTTAVTGAGASTTAASAVVTGIDTTGVSSGDLLWVQSSSGRQFSIIATVDSGTQVTCDDTFANTEGSRTWAIGGKRATWDNTDSRALFSSDAKAGFIIETETDQTLTSSITYSVSGNNTDGFIHIRGASTTTHPVILQTVAGTHFQGASSSSAGWSFNNLKFTNSAATSSSNNAIEYRDNNNRYLVSNCIFGDATNTLNSAISINGGGNAPFLMIDCEFQYLDYGPYGTASPTGDRDATYINCISHNNGSFGFNICEFDSLINCIAHDNTGPGFLLEQTGSTQEGCSVSGCIAYNNTGDGIQIEANHGPASVNNCVLVSNGGYGIEKDTRSADVTLTYNYFNNNAFYGNTSGEVSANITTLGPDGHTTLTADPFTNAASADFTINTTSGGGADLRTTAVTLGSTETRPFRWLDTSTGGGATLASDARIERLK